MMVFTARRQIAVVVLDRNLDAGVYRLRARTPRSIFDGALHVRLDRKGYRALSHASDEHRMALAPALRYAQPLQDILAGVAVLAL